MIENIVLNEFKCDNNPFDLFTPTKMSNDLTAYVPSLKQLCSYELRS